MGHFRRIEDKLLLPIENLNYFLSLIKTKMSLSFPNINTKYSDIRSIYFDSPKLKLFEENIRKNSTRFKFRLRQYGPNGIWGDAFAEVKIKENGISTKDRVKIDKSLVDHITHSSNSKYAYKLLNLKQILDEEGIHTVFQRAPNDLFQMELNPVISILYRRIAYECLGLRLTIDSNLNFKFLNGSLKHDKSKFDNEFLTRLLNYNKNTHYILEIKHNDNLPRWLIDATIEVSAIKSDFSKYCWGVTKHYERIFSSNTFSTSMVDKSKNAL